MLSRIIEFSLTQRGFILLVAALVCSLGWYAFRQTPIDAFPDISSPQVKVILRAPGMTPEEIEARITAPIEVEMLGIPRQRVLRSVTKYGLTDITVDFEEGTDIYWARQQVAERFAAIRDLLPAEVEGGVAPLTTPLGEMFMFTVESADMTLHERRALLDWTIRPALRTVPGVADVNVLGGRVETFEIVPRWDRMLAYGVTIAALSEALRRNNRDDGSGQLEAGEEVLLVRARGAVRSLEDVAAIVVVHRDPPIRVGDLADVRLGSLARYGAVTRDGTGETVQGLVLGLRGANARDVVRGVRQKLAEIAPTLPSSVAIDVFYDRGDLVDRAVGTVRGAVIAAVVLVLVVLIAFLSDWRAAVTAALVLPVSVLATFLWMWGFGLTANLMSLGGLAIAIGMLVDAAVVVVESATVRLATPGAEKLPRRHVILRATREVAAPVVAGTVIIVLVLLPLLTLTGLEGKLFAPVALTIVFALVSALLVSFTLLPVVASLVVRPGTTQPVFLPPLERAYRHTLDVALVRSRWVVAALLLLLGAAALAAASLGRSFLPELDEGATIVQLEGVPTIRLETSLDQNLRMQRELMARVPEIAGIVSRTGVDEIGLDPMGLHQSDAFLRIDADATSRLARGDLLERIRTVMRDFPGIAYGLTQPIEMRVAEMLTGVRGDVAVKIYGHDLHDLDDIGAEVAEILGDVAGAVDVFRTMTEGAEYFEVAIDRLLAGRLGVDVVVLQEHLRALVEGSRVGTVYDGARRIPVMIRGEQELRESPWEFAQHRMVLDSGGSVPLNRLATVEIGEGPVQIHRESAARLVVVTANVQGRDLVGFVDEARRHVAERVVLPSGMRIEWGGQFENQQRAARRLGIVVPIALGMIFVILFASFRSVPQALLVLGNVPLALIGGVFSLWWVGEYLSVPATIGFIALLGIAVLNGLVLVSTFNQRCGEGHPLDDAVREGAVRRLRPVLMTATSTALGLAPLWLAQGPGAELQRPLAAVVIGGLVSATALTLVVLPVAYLRLERGRRGGGRR